MCRWVVYLGDEPLMLEDLLIRPNHSIVKQVNERFLPGLFYGLEDSDKEELKQQAKWINVHGFGVAWYTNTRSQFDLSVQGMLPALYKTIAPISTDIPFEQLCANTASNCTMAHIRDASFIPVVEINNHPFTFGKYSVMHNGGVNNFALIRFSVLRRIEQLQRFISSQQPSIQSSVTNGNYIFNIMGNTDTEHFANLFMAHLDIVKSGIIFGKAGSELPFDEDSTDALLLALIDTIADIHRIQKIFQVGPFTPGQDRVGNSLNLCITDGGTQTLVCRWRDAPEGYPPSLYLSLTAGEKLNRKYYPDPPQVDPSRDLTLGNVRIQTIKELVDNYQPNPQQGKHVVIGSEPCTYDVRDWGLFDQNQAVTADKDGRLRIINLAKFFQPGREQEFRKFKFDKILSNLPKDASVEVGIPKDSLELPAAKANAFEADLQL